MAARRLLGVVATSLLLAAGTGLPVSAAPDASRILAVNPPAAGELKGGEVCELRIKVTRPGQLLRVEIEQAGVDLAIALRSPTGDLVGGVDTVQRPAGVEDLNLILGAAGVYSLELRAKPRATGERGAYRAYLRELRPAGPRDPQLIRAWNTYDEARELQVRKVSGESLDEAVRLFRSTIPVWSAARQPEWLASTLDNIGSCHRLRGRLVLAADAFRRALAPWRAAGNRRGEVMSLLNLGLTYRDLGDLDRAEASYRRALDRVRSLDDGALQARVLNNLGALQQRRGRPLEALDLLHQAAELRRQAGDAAGLAVTLNNLGSVYTETGELGRAAAVLKDALSAAQQGGNRRAEAAALANLGLVLDWSGQSLEAAEQLRRSLDLNRDLGDRRGEAAALRDLGALYLYLGDLDQATDYFVSSRRVYLDQGDTVAAASALVNVGWVHSLRGEHLKALEAYREALPSLQKDASSTSLPSALEKLAGTYAAIGRSADARDAYQRALRLSRDLHQARRQIRVRLGLGRLEESAGHLEVAAGEYRQALQLSRSAGYQLGMAEALAGGARVAQGRGDAQTAWKRINQALQVIEAIRGKLTAQHFQTSFLASRRDYYELAIDLAIAQHLEHPSWGYDRRAFDLSERSRARSLLDLVSQIGIDLREGGDAGLLAEEQSLRHQIQSLERLYLRLDMVTGADLDRKAPRPARLAELITRYREVEGLIRRQSSRYRSLTEVRPLDLASIQRQVLDSDTAMLVYSLGSRRSSLWVVTKDGMVWCELPPRARIEGLAQRLRRLWTLPGSRPSVLTPTEREAWRRTLRQGEEDFGETAAELSRLILGPAAPLLRGKRKMAIVADGALHYIPFAALPVPVSLPRQVPLIAEYAVVRLPSASVLAVIRRELSGRPPAPKTLALLADPVVAADDERLQGRRRTPALEPPAPAQEKESPSRPGAKPVGSIGFQRLHYAGEEAQMLAQLVPREQALDARGFRASRATALDPALGEFRFVHFATHAYIDDRFPELSALVLSSFNADGDPQDGLLRLQDIYGLHLRAELVSLSACSTALGTQVDGEGLIGLTRGFFYAGVPRVIATLWPVEDSATAELMTKFYTLVLRQRVPPSEALRRAQLEMWRCRDPDDWHTPFYWAGFELHGDWR